MICSCTYLVHYSESVLSINLVGGLIFIAKNNKLTTAGKTGSLA